MNTTPFIEKIHIAILGPVSAGKSTFFNALCSNTCSDMKRKKTTMLPQIYNITNDIKNIDSIDSIYNKNKESNEQILKQREDGTFNIDQDFNEIVHTINKIPEFIDLLDKNATYSILDMPGLNCGGDSLYYDYIKKISNTIDIYILVFDINSGLNTTDEINIIKMVIDEIKKNKNGYIHILINKCDEIIFNENGSISFEDEELNELYVRCTETIHKLCLDIIDKVTITPLCSSKLYIYRSVKNNIKTIDENQLDNIIKSECGKQELKKLTTPALKRKFISGLLKKQSSELYNGWMTDTGFNEFVKNLSNIVKGTSYINIIFYHINESIIKLLLDINTKNISNFFDELCKELSIINSRIDRLKSFNKKLVIPTYIINNLDTVNTKINTYLMNGITSYSGSTVNLTLYFLKKIDEYYNIVRRVFTSNPLEESKKVLDNQRLTLLEIEFDNFFDINIFIELYNKNKITEPKFKNSIHTTLSKDIMLFRQLINDINNYKHILNKTYIEVCIDIIINEYIDIIIDKNLEFSILLVNLEIILQNKINDLLLISKFISTYFSQKRFNEKYNSIINFWFIINSSKLLNRNSKIQCIFMNIFTLIKLNFQLNLTYSVEEYEIYTGEMNLIYNLLTSYIDKSSIEINLIDIDNQPDKKKNLRITIDKNDISESDDESDKSVSSEDEMNVDYNLEEYYDSDSSANVYKKASANTSKRANKIINLTI